MPSQSQFQSQGSRGQGSFQSQSQGSASDNLVRLRHRTEYRFASAVDVFPHIVRLYPQPFLFTAEGKERVRDYRLAIDGAAHQIHWQIDPFGNTVARVTFNEPCEQLAIDVDLTADLTPINPFDFYLAREGMTYPVSYPDHEEPSLIIFRSNESLPAEDRDAVRTWITENLGTDLHGTNTVDLIVDINQKIRGTVGYTTRLETGVQSPAETLRIRTGSCRDSAWLQISVLRELGFAARFVSGYLAQIPDGQTDYVGDLHAWLEVYVPGAGWIGLDATSGLLTGAGHIPLAASPTPGAASPISGTTGVVDTELDFSLDVTRVGQ